MIVPYNAILMARERFYVFCGVEAIVSILKLFFTYLLLQYHGNKLEMYTYIIAAATFMPGIFYYIYCKKHFKEYIQIKVVSGFSNYKPILKFSVWSGYGAFIQVGQTQCAALFVNAFFSTLMNTALGVTNYLKSAVVMLSDNLTKSISPQITKNYASGNMTRCINLMVLISKISFFATLIISTPFLIYPEFIINIWLGQVPEYSVLFTKIVMITIVIGSFNKGISEYIFATGNIKVYQFIVNSLLFISVVVAYIVLKIGAEAYSILYVYLFFELLAVFVRQIILRKIYNFNNIILYKRSYAPSLLIAFISTSFVLFKDFLSPLLGILIFAFVQFVCFAIIGLTKVERNKVINYVISKIKL